MIARPIRLLSLLFALVAAASLPACRSSNAYDVADAEAGGATLVVRNDNFSDMDVYVLSSGLPSRIGTVTANASQTFALRPSMFSGADDFRVVATPIGGNGRASSGRLQVSGGQTVYFTIGARLAQSSATVR